MEISLLTKLHKELENPGSISWFVPNPGTVTAVNGNINAMKKQDILEDHLWPVVAQHFPQGGTFFKMIMLQSTAQDRLSLTKLKTISSLIWPAQSPDFNII